MKGYSFVKAATMSGWVISMSPQILTSPSFFAAATVRSQAARASGFASAASAPPDNKRGSKRAADAVIIHFIKAPFRGSSRVYTPRMDKKRSSASTLYLEKPSGVKENTAPSTPAAGCFQLYYDHKKTKAGREVVVTSHGHKVVRILPASEPEFQVAAPSRPSKLSRKSKGSGRGAPFPL